MSEPEPPQSGQRPPERRRGTGRARNQEARGAILTAAFELARSDLPGLTVDGIAARANVGKQTIYRWWPSKWAVLLDALQAYADQNVQPASGTLQERVTQFLAATFDLATRADGSGALLRALMAQAQLDPRFGELWRERLIQPRRSVLIAILAEPGPGQPPHPDPQTATDLLFGAMWYRLLVGHGPLDAAYAAQLTDAVFAGVGCHPLSSGTPGGSWGPEVPCQPHPR